MLWPVASLLTGNFGENTCASVGSRRDEDSRPRAIRVADGAETGPVKRMPVAAVVFDCERRLSQCCRNTIALG